MAGTIVFAIIFTIFLQSNKNVCNGAPAANTVRLCSDQQRTIACGNNEIIKIKFVFWGRRTQNVCGSWLDYRRCSSKKAFDVVRDKCNFKQQCDIEASKSELGNPGCWYLTSVYLEVSYTCFSLPSEQSVTLCPNEQKTIACGNNEIIQISSVFWGRRAGDVCAQWLDYRRCNSANAFDIIGKKCNFKNQCYLEPSKSELGDPGCWYLTSVYLEASYACISAQRVKSVRLCENQNANMKCGRNEVIQISSVFWGRSEGSICGTWLDYRRCSSSGKAFDIIRKKCNFKKQCDLTASKNELGDPGCWYLTSVYLEVSHICIGGGKY